MGRLRNFSGFLGGFWVLFGLVEVSLGFWY